MFATQESPSGRTRHPERSRRQPEMEFLTGFESTYICGSGKDVLDLTGHTTRLRADLESVAAAGIRTIRYSIPWHKIERVHGEYDWAWLDLAMEAVRELGLEIIADPLHHTSFPDWLTDGFADPRFVTNYVRFVLAFADRYPQVSKFTYVNEPYTTSWFCGHEGMWHPRMSGDAAFVRMILHCAEAICRSDKALRAERSIEYLHIEACERHTAVDPSVQAMVDWNNHRRFLVHDLILGNVSMAHPMYEWLRAHGLTEQRAWWFQASAAYIDVLGLDFYEHCEIAWDKPGRIESVHRRGFASVAKDYARRFPGPALMLAETNVRGTPQKRVDHFGMMQRECADLRAWLHFRDRHFAGFCWYPWIDSTDWDSLVTRADGHIDPQGVYSLAEDGCRIETSFTREFIQATTLSSQRNEDRPSATLLRENLPSACIPNRCSSQPLATTRPLIIVGLPASGKTLYARSLLAGRSHYEDIHHWLYHRDQYIREGNDRFGRFLDDLHAGRPFVIDSVEMCERTVRERFLGEYLSHLSGVDWLYFENEPEQCRRNAQLPEHRGESHRLHRLREIDRASPVYDIPEGANVRAVYCPLVG